MKKKELFRFPRSGDRTFQREGAVLRTDIYMYVEVHPI